MSELTREVRELFEEEKKKCSSLNEVREEHPDVGKAVDRYLESEDFTAATGARVGKSCKEKMRIGCKLLLEMPLFNH